MKTRTVTMFETVEELMEAFKEEKLGDSCIVFDGSSIYLSGSDVKNYELSTKITDMKMEDLVADLLKPLKVKVYFT